MKPKMKPNMVRELALVDLATLLISGAVVWITRGSLTWNVGIGIGIGLAVSNLLFAWTLY